MARLIADRLGTGIDVTLVAKLHAPTEPGLSIGAIDEYGQVCLADFAREDGVSREYLQHEKDAQLAVLRARRAAYTPFHPPTDPSGRTVILVDDDVVTGATMVAAIRSMRAHRAADVIVAVAVAPPGPIEHLENEADAVLCACTPESVHAAGHFFDDCADLSDREILATLTR